jgi:hypothetical protein
MGIESRRGAFHSLPLLTRLSIARSTSIKDKHPVSILFTHDSRGVSLILNIPSKCQKLNKIPSSDYCELILINPSIDPYQFTMIGTGLISSQVRPHSSSSAATRRIPTQPLFFLGRGTNGKVAGREHRRREKVTEHTVKLGGKSRAIIALGNGARACQVGWSARFFFWRLSQCGPNWRWECVWCIPDREGGTGCSHETWRAAGACQPCGS